MTQGPRGLGVSSQAEVASSRGGQHEVCLWPEAALAALVDGSESGWDTGCLWVSRLVLGALVGSLSRRREPGLSGLDRALVSAARAMASCQPPSPEDSIDFFSPSATLIAAHITADRAEIAWIGPHRAALVRGGQVVSSSRPHTLENLLREQGKEIPDGIEIPDVCVRYLSGTGPYGGAEGVTWALEPGDRVALLSRAFEGVDEGALAGAAGQGDLAAAVAALAALPEGVRAPGRVAAVLLAP